MSCNIVLRDIMRDMKFRAWDKKENKMLPDFTYNALLDARLNNVNSWKKSDRIKMQYTGLQDMHNVDIYEGDVVTFRYPPAFRRTGTVVFQDGCFDVEFHNPIHLDNGTARQWDYLKVFVANGGVEILGNVFENPEFTEQNK